MLAVAPEELVRALARQGDCDVFRGELRECEEPERREVGKRLVQVPDEIPEVDLERVERELELVVLAPELLGDEPSFAQLVAGPGLREPNGKRLHRLGHVPGHQGDDQARVQASAQHRAERNVAHQTKPDGLFELLQEPLGPLLRARRLGRDGRRGIAPVALDPNLAALDHQPVTRLELRNAREGRCGRWEKAESEKSVDRLVVEPAVDEPAREQALQL